MHMLRATCLGSPFLGVYMHTTDQFTLVPPNIPDRLVDRIAETLKTEVVRCTVGGTTILGALVVGNKEGYILPEFAEEREVIQIRESTGLPVTVVEGRLTALGNNLLVNDHGGIVHVDMDGKNIGIIEKKLGVELVKLQVGNIKTVGAMGVVTNRGMLFHPIVSEEEMERIEEIFGVPGDIGTANRGVCYVGSCMIANTKGFVTGRTTTGIELARIDEALGFVGAGEDV
ncbi:MAG: translation initiation factor IF-6 [Methanobacteriota archaeon]|nr:MAG: translation initiation factor IF-6 [Euryarchaeota archaeon]